MKFSECIEKYIKEGYIGEDFTCNGKCSKCGECCGSILPLDQEDANKIQDYVVKNRVFPQRQLLIVRGKLQCPYYTGNRNKGCSIYDARPKICRMYQCNKKPTVDEVLSMKKAMPVDMWAFATAIEKEMKKHGINKEARKTTNESV